MGDLSVISQVFCYIDWWITITFDMVPVLYHVMTPDSPLKYLQNYSVPY